MTDKPETWLWKEPAAPMQGQPVKSWRLRRHPARSSSKSTPAPCGTKGSAYVFGAVHQKAADDVRPQSRIEGHGRGRRGRAVPRRQVGRVETGIVPCGATSDAGSTARSPALARQRGRIRPGAAPGHRAGERTQRAWRTRAVRFSRRPRPSKSADETLTAGDLQIVSRVAAFHALRSPRRFRMSSRRPMRGPEAAFIDIIVRQDDPATAIFIVISGWVKLYRNNPAGEEAVVEMIASGASFCGSLGLHRQPLSRDGGSGDGCAGRLLPADHIVRCIQENPAIAVSMVASISEHMHYLVRQVEHLKGQTGLQRVAEFPGVADRDRARPVRLRPALRQDADRPPTGPDAGIPVARLAHLPRGRRRVVNASSVTIEDIAKLRQLATDERANARGVLQVAFQAPASLHEPTRHRCGGEPAIMRHGQRRAHRLRLMLHQTVNLLEQRSSTARPANASVPPSSSGQELRPVSLTRRLSTRPSFIMCKRGRDAGQRIVDGAARPHLLVSRDRRRDGKMDQSSNRNRARARCARPSST